MSVNNNGNDDAAIIPSKNWYSVAETLYLENNGPMTKVRVVVLMMTVGIRALTILFGINCDCLI
ncbi:MULTISPECIES: hypothetical protein [Furfurilactobacillus]|uniref:Uncharacterized protein n=1 Tax=Furfurilactobacillus rossiae TaxID=231049 RepID=A0A7C9J158_9LACO|nr:hypothetical protein [Furfurilactobacillus milii]MYV05675.1 hypothetical protein [Furfurilactobacillus milii]